MAHKNSLASPSLKSFQSKSTKSLSFSSDSSDSTSFKMKSFTKTVNSVAKQHVKGSDVLQQLSKLQEELNKEKEEKSRVMEEFNAFKKNIASHKITGESKMKLGESKMKLEALEKEAQKAKESERKMLESLISQTKLLEQLKISLEEAKLENRTLQESNKTLQSHKHSRSLSFRNLEKHLRGSDPAEEEIKMLRNELRLSTQAEEKSRIAMDSLAFALKDATTEANQAKARLTITQSELEKVGAEADSWKTLLKSTEEKFHAASEESERLKFELEESVAAWNEKEKSFISCINVSEEEITKAKSQNDKLFESQRTAREENANLRDILKQAVSEASIVKESLEIARKENSQLKDLLSQKENELQELKQQFECLRVSEAAATDSVKELKSLLAATSTLDSTRLVSSSHESESILGDSNDSKVVPKFSSERWSAGNARAQNGHRHSIGEPGKFKGSALSVPGSPTRKARVSASISNMSEIRAASSFAADDDSSLYYDDSVHLDTNHFDATEQTAKQKKKPILRRFGDMLRRKSSRKQNTTSAFLR